MVLPVYRLSGSEGVRWVGGNHGIGGGRRRRTEHVGQTEQRSTGARPIRRSYAWRLGGLLRDRDDAPASKGSILALAMLDQATMEIVVV